MNESMVLRRDERGVALLTLNRPERRNALSRGLVSALTDELSRLEVDREVRAVVLTGAGTVFCAGMDMKEAEASGRSTDAERLAIADARGLADLLQQLHTLPKPTVAALNGDALAGGAGLAMACDLVVAGENVRLGYPEVLRGLVAAVVMTDLVRIVGERRARQLLLTGEPIGALQAEQWGLVNQVTLADQCLAVALTTARSLARGGPIALATVKKLLDDATRRPADLRGPAAISASVRVSDEATEGMRAFLERRPPAWAVEPS